MVQSMVRRDVRKCFYTLLAVALCASHSQGELWQRIAGTLGTTPGVPGYPNARHFILEGPTLNDNGDVAFHSFLDPFLVGPNNDTIWGGPASQPQLVARKGDIAPSTSETFVGFDSAPLLNNGGQVLVSGSVSGPSSQSNGLWLGTPGNLQLLARQGTPIPGSPHSIFSIDESSLTLSDNGKAAFTGFTQSFSTAMWYGSPGNLSVVAVGGSPVPASSGLPAGVKFQEFLTGGNAPVLNTAGAVVFQVPIANSDLSIFGDSIWTGTPGNLQLVAREDGAAPNLPGVKFQIMETLPVINASGQIAFGAHLDTHTDSIWLGTPGNLELIVKGNDSAPVGVAGVHFSEIGMMKELRISNSGHVGFEGWLDGAGVNPANDYGLFRATTSGVDMVTRKGAQAPGLPGGISFNSFNYFSMNAEGHMAFIGEVSSGGQGIWAEGADGELKLVVQVGDWVHPLTGEVVHTADANDPTSLESQGFDRVFMLDFRSAFQLSAEHGTAWNDDHQLAFEVVFEDLANGTAVFLTKVGGQAGDFDKDGDVDGRDFLVWQRTDRTSAGLAAWQQSYGQPGSLKAVTAIPEPATIFLLVAGVMGMGHRRYLVR